MEVFILKKNITFLLVASLLMSSLIGCSNFTVSEHSEEGKGLVSKDEAEVMVYNILTEEEKEQFIIDYYKEEKTKYYIQVYKQVNGEMKEKRVYTVDYHTKEIRLIK
jgi:hypothetical protein